MISMSHLPSQVGQSSQSSVYSEWTSQSSHVYLQVACQQTQLVQQLTRVVSPVRSSARRLHFQGRALAECVCSFPQTQTSFSLRYEGNRAQRRIALLPLVYSLQQPLQPSSELVP